MRYKSEFDENHNSQEIFKLSQIYQFYYQIKISNQMSSPSKLFSCVDANAILRSPVNNSSAKNHWSFSKNERFPTPRPKSDVFYDIPDMKNQRKTGFGYGKKIDLNIGKHRHNISPSPDTYDLKDFPEINKNEKKGFFPGYGREETAPRSYIDLEAKKTPGPGRYSQDLSRESPKWSMRPRTTSELFVQTTQKIVPGPGHYESTECLSPQGKYYTSKHMNSKSKVFNPKYSKRFAKSSTNVPGPGAYQPKNNLSGDGFYILSKSVSSGRRIVLDGRRGSFVDIPARRTQTPGPGSYRPHSDFGHYDDIPSKSVLMSSTKGSSVFNISRK